MSVFFINHCESCGGGIEFPANGVGDLLALEPEEELTPEAEAALEMTEEERKERGL